MQLPTYFSGVTEELRSASERARTAFASHRPSLGTNREEIVADFLRNHLPHRYGVGSGLVFNKEGLFSNQADVVLYDALFSRPFYSTSPNSLFPVESVLGLIEVKSSMPPADIRDSISKCSRFKKLARQFSDRVGTPRLADSLFVIWAFDSPSAETFKANYTEALSGFPVSEHPDFVVVPSKLLLRGGSFREVSLLGQPGSVYRAELVKKHGHDLSKFMPGDFDVLAGDQNLLLAWFVWTIAWLEGAIPRSAPLETYIPSTFEVGKKV